MSSRHASQVKRGGHLREQIFSNQFCNESMSKISKTVNYSGSTADCLINDFDSLYIVNDLNANSGYTSVKGGSTYQFHLGKIPELIDYNTLQVKKLPSESDNGKLQTCFSSDITREKQHSVLKSYEFWKKYLGKGDILAIDANDKWHFFLMHDVLELLINEEAIAWRFLPTGRIKGDLLFKNNTKKAGITFEHRFEKNQSVLGAHGGNAGIQSFLPWLIDHITNIIVIHKMRT